jgi:hypothetical protein
VPAGRRSETMSARHVANPARRLTRRPT